LLKRLKGFGIRGEPAAGYDCGGVLAHVREVVKKISTHHPAEVFEKRGIKVLFGSPRFIDSRSVEYEGRRIQAKRFIFCTGWHPLVPPIEGLKDADYLTNENVFDLEAMPRSLAVLGGGPIGIELSQAFARLGVEVSIVEMADRLLIREEKEAADLLADRLKEEGIKIYTGMKAVKITQANSETALTLEDKDKKQTGIKAQNILVAAGRLANVGGLGLKEARVKYTPRGIEVDNTLRTTAENIYACGDVVGPYQFSHVAEYQAVIAAGNALFPFKRKADYRVVPWCTFTDPELARVGLTEEEAVKIYKGVKVYRSAYAANDRAVTDIEEGGFAKVVCGRGGRILGAHIVGASAGELIHEYVLAMQAKLKVESLSSAIHVYPTLAQVVKRSGDAYYMEMLSGRFFRGLAKFFVARLA
jgi:pyruvate/2-oxoglutarate dehydrogenase complex dihydrolipoamide dehydrogenase (E3) component